MLRSFIKIFIVSAQLAFFSSCSKNSEDNGAASCTVIYTDSQPISSDQAVQYNAGVQGKGGTINTISYLDSAGTTIVKNPSLPWVIIVNLKKGAVPSITAVGIAFKGGQVNVSAYADGIQYGTSCVN
jgi:hypothetical protein